MGVLNAPSFGIQHPFQFHKSLDLCQSSSPPPDVSTEVQFGMQRQLVTCRDLRLGTQQVLGGANQT